MAGSEPARRGPAQVSTGVPNTAPDKAPTAPREAYAARLHAREAEQRRLRAIDLRLSRARLLSFLLALILVGVAAFQPLVPGWTVAVPLVAFLLLAAAHERVLRRCARSARAAEFYRSGLDRLDGRWAGKGQTRRDLLGDDHPYAGDLDLFGEGSLFDLLSRARTRAGEETLARWLGGDFGPAPGPGQDPKRLDRPPELAQVAGVRARQAAVIELRDALELREAMAVLGDDARIELRPAALVGWGRATPLFSTRQRRWLPVAGLALPLVLALSVLVASLGWTGAWWLAAGLVVIDLAIYRGLAELLRRVAGPLDRHSRELEVLARVLERIEASTFTSSELLRIHAEFGAEGSRASEAIARLRRLAGWYEAQNNALFAIIAVPLLWGPNFALAIERWRAEHGPAISRWLAALGELEALASLASHAFEHPGDPFAELHEGERDDAGRPRPQLRGENLGHPLLARDVCVRNSISLGLSHGDGPGDGLADGPRALVISGSNMSGKSTFLRTVGTNVVLALAGAPVRAESLSLSPLRIGATLRVQDSLREGASRFWAELVRLRTIAELAEAGPTLFLLDEVFHGTNSHDRRIGAEALLRSLIERGAIGMLTTHDLALAEAAEALAPAASNFHFCDELVDGELVFDYRMRSGVVRKSNALALMRAVGLVT